MSNPKFVKIGNKKYPINTDFRVAIKCNDVALNNDINNFEKSLAIIYLLYGDEGLKDDNNYEMLLELAFKYLNCGKENIEDDNSVVDMDLKKDERLIESSFKYDYRYNPYKMKYLHWWDFYNDLCNLSNSELGSCCVLNRVRNLRTYDTSQIKDASLKAKIEKAKQQVSLEQKEIKLSDKQKESIDRFNKLAGLE